MNIEQVLGLDVVYLKIWWKVVTYFFFLEKLFGMKLQSE